MPHIIPICLLGLPHCFVFLSFSLSASISPFVVGHYSEFIDVIIFNKTYVCCPLDHILQVFNTTSHTLSFLPDLDNLPPNSPLHDYEYPETPDSYEDETSPRLDFDFDPNDKFDDLDEASNCKFLTIKTYITITFSFYYLFLMAETLEWTRVLLLPRCVNNLYGDWPLFPN